MKIRTLMIPKLNKIIPKKTTTRKRTMKTLSKKVMIQSMLKKMMLKKATLKTKMKARLKRKTHSNLIKLLLNPKLTNFSMRPLL